MDTIIGKKILWKGEEYSIIDTHNTSDFVILNDANMSIINLNWDDVKLI